MNDQNTTEFDSKEDAAAFLAAKSIDRFSNTKAKADGQIVKLWIDGSGKNLSNVGSTFDMDVGEIGPVEAYNELIQQEAPDEANVFANLIVHGLRSPDTEGFGYGSPVHTSMRDGAKMLSPEKIPDDVRQAASTAGLLFE
jgi:hypothetical protein